MMPSQGGWPLLASNEESTTTSDACGTVPITQVKILRRPKPNEINRPAQSKGEPDKRITTSDATSGRGLVESGRKSEQATSSSYYVDDDEWPSLAETESKNFGSQKQKYNVLKKISDTKCSPVEVTNQTVLHDAMVPKTSKSVTTIANNPTFAVQPDSLDTHKVPKAPIKTYKERADEYAKARLRILGSAFSDEDKDNNDDIVNIN